MKKDLHPNNYRLVVFKDLNNGTTYLTRSTVETSEKIKLADGIEYPLINVHISSSSHPFFTGEERIVDIEGRVDKFKARAAAGQAARKNLVEKSSLKKAPKKVAKKPVQETIAQ